jgi:drug/metabolite transporter (DMT)-like permease
MTDILAQSRPAAIRLGPAAAGALWGLGAAVLWSGWWVMTRYGITGALPGSDLAALRFGVAGLVMLPILLRHRRQLLAAPPLLLAVMATGAGAPYALVAGTGLSLAPAGQGGALTLGLLPMFTAILAALTLGEAIGRQRRFGLTVIGLGAVLVAGHGLGGAWAGHLIFALGAAMWAGFSVAMRRSGLSPMATTAAVCVLSAVLYLPLYAAFLAPGSLLASTPGLLVAQAIYQGVLSAFGALYCYGRAIACLGPTRAALFAALVPALSTAMGAAMLGEVPSPGEALGVALLSTGAALAARGR